MPLNELQTRILSRNPAWTPPWELFRRQEEANRAAQQAFARMFAGNTATTVPRQIVAEEDMAEKLVNPFQIGCDPEFVVLEPNGHIHNVAADFDRDGSGVVGFDHQGLEVEIRPNPARGSYALLKRIQAIIKTNPRLKKIEGFKWRAGAVVKNGNRNLTLGGHVHLDISPRDPNDRLGETFKLRLNALDRCTKYLEALDILPRDECALRRDVGDPNNAGQRYGKWSDYREKGDGTRFEYRTMSSWLYDPTAAYLALTMAKLAATAPQLAVETLKVRSISYENLKEFFELFRHKDTNAKRALDKLLVKNVTQLQAQPDVDFKNAWKELPC
jgi:hypothetical protein